MFDTQIVFLKEFLEKVDFGKKSTDDKKEHEKFSKGQRVNPLQAAFERLKPRRSNLGLHGYPSQLYVI